MLKKDDAPSDTLCVVRYVAQLTPSNLMPIQGSRALIAFEDPDVVMLESCISVRTVSGMSDFGTQVGSRIWAETPEGPVARPDDTPSLPAHLGYRKWTGAGQVLLAAGPELCEGLSSFSLFTTRLGVMMSWTGSSDEEAQWARKAGPFRASLGPSWGLGVMLIDRRKSNHELLPAMAEIQKDLEFHHAVMGQVVGRSFALERIDLFAEGPWPIPG